MQVMYTFRGRYPCIRLTIEILSTNRTHEQLIANQIDLGISTPPPANVGLIFEPILTETPVLLLPKNHSLLQQDEILLSDLCAECLLLTDPPCAYRTAIEQAFMARGLSLAIGIEIGSLEIIKQAVQQGMGVAIMPKLATYHIPDDTVIRPIKDWKLHMPLGLITREVPLPQSKAVQAFSFLLKQAAADA